MKRQFNKWYRYMPTDHADYVQYVRLDSISASSQGLPVLHDTTITVHNNKQRLPSLILCRSANVEWINDLIDDVDEHFIKGVLRMIEIEKI